MFQILLCRQWRATLHPLSVVIKISLAALVKMHCWEREQLGHYFSGLSVDDKGPGGAGGPVRVYSERQTHYEYCGIRIHCRNRP